MRDVLLEQNSPEWIQWRGLGLGSSDISSLLGLSRFETRGQLADRWRAGAGLRDFQNEDTLRGQALEAEARAQLNQQLGTKFVLHCAEWERDPFLHASFDGYDARLNLICEIKAPRGFRPLADEVYWQVQTQLLVSGAKANLVCQAVRLEGRLHLRTLTVKPNRAAFAKIARAVRQFKREVLRVA